MDSPTTPSAGTSMASGRSSVIDSLRGCTLAGVRVPKEELRRKITFPEYLRLAVRAAIHEKSADAPAVSQLYDSAHMDGAEPVEPTEFPIIVFINSRSGGRHGPELKARLHELMGEEQVFDLSEVKPHEFVLHGLTCIEKFAGNGDACAKQIREKLRIVVAGGDGTVGWVLGCLGELNKKDRMPIPPTGIIPLGTGNDLARSFGWGGSFPFNWKSAIKRTLEKVTSGPVVQLDSWHVLISMPAGRELEVPHSLKESEETPLDQELEADGEKPEKVACYQGVFYNYFSIGMDAQVAYGFHTLRNEKPYHAQGPISNKNHAFGSLVRPKSPAAAPTPRFGVNNATRSMSTESLAIKNSGSVGVLAIFPFLYKGIQEIMADYVHHEMTRHLVMLYFRLFLIVAAKDVFVSLAF